jgi:bacteriorhodopsin
VDWLWFVVAAVAVLVVVGAVVWLFRPELENDEGDVRKGRRRLRRLRRVSKPENR